MIFTNTPYQNTVEPPTLNCVRLGMSDGDFMNTIQAGTAQILTYTDQPFTIRFSGAKVLIIQSRTNDVWVSMSEGGLQSDNARFKLHKDNSPDPNNLVLPFAVPCSGTLFFASAHATATAHVSVMTLSGDY